MMVRKEGERCFATNLQSYKVNHFPVLSGLPGQRQVLRGRGLRNGLGGFT